MVYWANQVPSLFVKATPNILAITVLIRDLWTVRELWVGQHVISWLIEWLFSQIAGVSLGKLLDGIN